MTTISNIAQRLLDENNYTATTTFTLTKVEYLIDNSIDYINMETGRSIAHLTGSAETKTLTAADDEIYAIKVISGLMVRAYKERGPNISAGPINAGMIISDPNYSFYAPMVKDLLARLCGTSFERV